MRNPLAVLVSLLLLAAFPGCGENDPDPDTVLDRALAPAKISAFGSSAEGPAGGVVSVQALGHEDAILNERQVDASPAVLAAIRDAIRGDSGLRELIVDLAYEGNTGIAGVETDHVSGELEVEGLTRALREAGATDVSGLAAAGGQDELGDSLTAAGFDLYAGEEDGVIRRLDLTLSFDDLDNALPATRIRFSLSPDPSSGSGPA